MIQSEKVKLIIILMLNEKQSSDQVHFPAHVYRTLYTNLIIIVYFRRDILLILILDKLQ
jgi:hypothetical protein